MSDGLEEGSNSSSGAVIKSQLECNLVPHFYTFPVMWDVTDGVWEC